MIDYFKRPKKNYKDCKLNIYRKNNNKKFNCHNYNKVKEA